MFEIALATPVEAPAAPFAGATVASVGGGSPERVASLPNGVATLSHAYVHAFFTTYPHRGVWAGWPGCAGWAPDLTASAARQRIAALNAWERHLQVWRNTLASAFTYANVSTRLSQTPIAPFRARHMSHGDQSLAGADQPFAPTQPFAAP